jgi:hypothetical protein
MIARPRDNKVPHKEQRHRRRGAWVVTVFAAMLALFALLPGVASAANAGNPDAGNPPCDTQSTSEHNFHTMYDPANGAVMGTAYLVYSAGCQTEWVTVHVNAGYSPSPSVWLQNQTGTDLYTAGSSGSTYWTYQLANMQYQVACGGVQMYRSSGAYVNWNYLGCY